MEEVKEREYYIGQIVEIINKANDSEFIVFLYRFAKRLKENWGI